MDPGNQCVVRGAQYVVMEPACGMWPVACSGPVNGNKTSTSCPAWTPDLPRLPASVVRGNGKTGGRGWDVGGGYLERRSKTSRGGLAGFDKNDVSYTPPPTPHLRRSRLIGPMPRPESTVKSPQIMLPPLGEGRGGGCWRCRLQTSGADAWPPYTPRPTPFTPE